VNCCRCYTWFTFIIRNALPVILFIWYRRGHARMVTF